VSFLLADTLVNVRLAVRALVNASHIKLVKEEINF
jgi:hypothetical protein